MSGILLRIHIPKNLILVTNAKLLKLCKILNAAFIDPNLLFFYDVWDCLCKDKIHLNYQGVLELTRILVDAPYHSGNYQRLPHVRLKL